MHCLGVGGASPSKYQNRRTTFNGVVYDSAAEAERAAELDLLLRGGAILDWQRQVTVNVGPCDSHTPELTRVRYRVDFLVVDDRGLTHAEDVKGFETDRFRVIKPLWIAQMKWPLVILKKKGRGWSREILWPIKCDRERYGAEWSGRNVENE